jgi:peptidylprolyl isomerase
LEQFPEELVPIISQEAFAAYPQPEVGRKLRTIDTDGQFACLAVLEVSEQTVTIDTNHPLAGEDLTFDILLVEIV